MHFSFDPAFQRHVIASFLEKDLAEGVDCLKEEYFEDEITGGVAGFVRDFYLANKEAPSKEALIHEIKERGVAPGRKITEYVEVIEEIFACVGENGEYFRDESKEFVHSRRLAQSLKDSYRLLEQGSREEALAEIQKAVSRNGAIEGLTHDYLEEIDSRAKEYFDSHRGKDTEGRIGTGFTLLDARIKGGLGSGETGVLVSPPKHGKTTALVSIASQILLRKRKVLYVTLELSQKVISSKFDTNIFGERLDEIKKKPLAFRTKLHELREDIRGGNLHIAEFPTKGLSLYKLQGLIEKRRPEIVFLDYASLMRSVRSKDERRFELSDIHEGLRGVAGACHVPIWTAHQANRPSLGRREIGMENIAEDFNIVAICDVAVSINQSEDERRSGALRLFVMGNRLGSSGDSIECNVNWALSRITPAFEDREIT